MKTDSLFLVLACTGVIIGTTRLAQRIWQSTAEASTTPAAAGSNDGLSSGELVARGKYMIQAAGCNDCHTPGFMQLGLRVPEDEWLTGVPVGWQGPWGTTYGSNLRQHLKAYPDVAVWISMVRSRQGMPPMPWTSLHSMTDGDLKAIYAYIRSLPVTGEVMPAALPPGQTPTTPWLVMEPVMPAAPKDTSPQ